MSNIKDKSNFLFETSWEVCNKVGGIYTVLSTKAKVLQKEYKNNLIFIGPDVWTKENPSPFFKESKTILKNWDYENTLPQGIKVRVGKWTIPGNPIAILVKFDSIYAIKDQVYGEMWEKFGVDSLHAYGDYDEGCAFGVAASMVIDSCAKHLAKPTDNVIAHFDEWTTGMGLLYTKAHSPKIATVFTTHATSIGRSICGNGKPLYDYFKNYNGDQMAAELNMQSKHSLEKAAAHNADCFTTVSEVTANECEQLLDIRPQVVTPNGFERAFVPKGKKYDEARATAREKLLNVASCLTGKKFDDDTFIVATSGRNEFRNKGLNMFIDTINEIRNNYPSSSKREIIAYILVPAWSMDARKDLKKALESKSKVHEGLEDPIITHTLHNYSSDCIYNHLHYLGLHNNSFDKVNVVYVPCYLNGDDGIFNMSYYDLLIGFDATVFPSYYEPWGYTPHEGIAFGVPTISTNLAGFGQWILSTFENSFQACGVKVVTRTDSNYFNSITEISNSLLELWQMSKTEIAKVRATAIKSSKKAEWDNFITYYHDAYKIALENLNK